MRGFRACWEEIADKGWLTRLLTCVATGLDSFWRRLDFRFNRSYGGWMKRWGLDDHCPLAFLLPVALLFFLVVGPTCSWPGGWALAWLLGGWVVLFVATKSFPARWLFWVELGVLALWAILLWILAPGDALEAENTLYRHFLIPLYLYLITLTLLVLPALIQVTFSGIQEEPFFGKLLPHVDLFAPPPKTPTRDRYWGFRGFAYIPMHYPLHLLFVPALLVLLLPYYVVIFWWAIGILVLWWLVLMSIADHRLSGSLQLMRRAFFIGGQLVVSLVVIALAIGRMMGFSYIQTVVESSNLKTLVSYIASAYVVFWFYEYWLNRILLEKLLTLLQPGSSGDGDQGRIEYSLDPGDTALENSAAAAGDRRLQIHGGGRFLCIGQTSFGLTDTNPPEEAFEPFEKRELFETLVRKAAWSSKVGKLAQHPDTLDKLAQIQWRIRVYFGLANLLVIVFAGLGWWWLNTRVQHAALEIPVERAISTDNRSYPPERQRHPVSLAERIWSSGSNDLQSVETRDKVLLLAASGGGTRAALYTESVLRGLALHNALDDLVLASGVSGGGTALAYLAAHHDELFETPPPSWRWDRFACDLSRPFIWDVLEGAAEWRIVTGTRTNMLLQESFERGFGFPQDGTGGTGAPKPLPTLGDAEIGLIFNTSLAGHLSVCRIDQETPFAQAAALQRERTDSSVAGGRLIFTNLQLGADFPAPRRHTCPAAEKPSAPEAANEFKALDPDLHLNYVVLDDLDIPLTTAAALHANFPPVFSNAPVDRWAEPDDVETESCRLGDRYWVTDGGAVENRGLISLLLALREAVATLDPADPPDRLPEIHILMAEASAGSHHYSQDRGARTSLGAAGKMADQLAAELLGEIEQSYGRVCLERGVADTGQSDRPAAGAEPVAPTTHSTPSRECGRVVYHDLAMPEILRIDSGLGTHWMLPRTVEISYNGDTLILGSDGVRHVIHALHQDNLPGEPLLCDGEGIGLLGRVSNAIQETLGLSPSREVRLAKLLAWVRDPNSDHQKAWKRFLCEYAEEGCDPG